MHSKEGEEEQRETKRDGKSPIRLLAKIRKLFSRFVGVILLLLLLYFVIVLIGLIPVNNDFAPAPDGVEIFLMSSSVHADVIVPIETEERNWREHFPADYFASDTSLETHVAISWGDKGFFIETEQWSDLKVSTVANALLMPSDSCMHAWFCSLSDLPADKHSVKISHQQYEQLIAFIDNSFKHEDNGDVQPIEDAAYGNYDAFFEANGTYHCFNTCNCWVGAAMRAAGIRTGWLTPLPKSEFLWLPEEDEGKDNEDKNVAQSATQK